MNTFKSGKPGGQRNKPKFIGGRPREDANQYGAKKSFGGKPSFNNDRGGSRGGDRGGFGGNQGGERREVQMHAATCADCGKACQVPFKPDGSKPVRCSDCFSNQPRERRDFGSRDDRPKRSFDGPRPERGPSPDMIALKEQVSGLESKLNQILALLKTAPAAPAAKEAAEPKAAKSKKVAVKKVVAKKAPAKKVAKKAAKKK